MDIFETGAARISFHTDFSPVIIKKYTPALSFCRHFYATYRRFLPTVSFGALMLLDYANVCLCGNMCVCRYVFSCMWDSCAFAVWCMTYYRIVGSTGSSPRPSIVLESLFAWLVSLIVFTLTKCSFVHKNIAYTIFYVPPAHKLVFTLQLRVA